MVRVKIYLYSIYRIVYTQFRKKQLFLLEMFPLVLNYHQQCKKWVVLLYISDMLHEINCVYEN